MEQRRTYTPELDGYRGLECKVCGAPATKVTEPTGKLNNAGQVEMCPRIVCSDINCTTHAPAPRSFVTPYDKYIHPGLLALFGG